jgi:hypothetical protein
MERALVVIFQEEWQRSTAGATVPPHPPADLDQLRLHRPQRDLELFVFANGGIIDLRCSCIDVYVGP